MNRGIVYAAVIVIVLVGAVVAGLAFRDRDGVAAPSRRANRRRRDQSGWRESNPHLNLGGVARYRYATPARVLSYAATRRLNVRSR